MMLQTHRSALSTTGASMRPTTQQHSFASRTYIHTTRSKSIITSAAPEEASEIINSNPLFNDQFVGILKDSLARQGVDALYEEAKAEGPRTSALEDVLGAALQTSKQTYRFLVNLRDHLDRTIAAQEKQINRMEFALNKARQDAAYSNALKNILYEQDSDA